MDASGASGSTTQRLPPPPDALGHRRRPSGEAPPLPHELGRTGRIWLLLALYLAIVIAIAMSYGPLRRATETVDTAVLRFFAELRTPWLTDLALVVSALASRWTIRILRWMTIGILVIFRRWRHLVVFLGAVVGVEILAYQLALAIARPRSFDVWIITDWSGFAMPSRPVVSISFTMIAIAYTLIVAGRSRYAAKWAITVLLGLLGISRMYLGVDQPSSVLFGAVLGVALGVTAFRWFAPNDVFPVSYRRGKTAHLDVGGHRGEAIGRAVRDQLGLEVVQIKPVGLEGSGGSTPLRLRVRGDDGTERSVFAKLYARSHVRADRWYKAGRTILYGALEDEAPFHGVRRFVEYEDYTLRLLEDYDLPTPEPYGIVEITPEREYMIVMEFFDGAVELGDAEIDEQVVDEGLRLVRNLWDAGLAHRDVKPANLMVQDGHLRLIDVFFVQVRPSPWRQAVDLANMMLVLALRSDAPTVYRRALAYFTEEEIAEAFAATRGVASPTQLRSSLKRDGRDLLGEFRALAPARPPVRIQRWSLRRIVLTIGVAFAAFLAVGMVVSNWTVFA
ncbi:MAG TPA: RIO1 family regulatory kinase/ATPase [Actinomycetota bacterium]|nr:RIO1 family regulatory kinase/ATPase [Actinomycetota bacterium]